jgi:hypothetical protein
VSSRSWDRDGGRGVRHDLHRRIWFAILDGGNGSGLLTQPLKGMSDASIQEARAPGGRSATLPGRGREKPRRQALRTPRAGLGHLPHPDRRPPPRYPLRPHPIHARSGPVSSGRFPRPAARLRTRLSRLQASPGVRLAQPSHRPDSRRRSLLARTRSLLPSLPAGLFPPRPRAWGSTRLTSVPRCKRRSATPASPARPTNTAATCS